MAIRSGRTGRVRWSPAGAGTPADLQEVISLNAWTLSLKTDFEDVSCFGDLNKVYVPGLRDIAGTIGGFYNFDEQLLIQATTATDPGLLELAPNTVDGSGTPLDAPVFTGLAYLDVDINCSLQAPKISGNFRAAGSWSLPV
jgi:hypothetical protein